MTTVLNLATGGETTYDQHPVYAVILAYQQSRGNGNWWNEGYFDIPVLVGRFTVACGDFCALRRRPRRTR
jgi:hypothetical protein